MRKRLWKWAGVALAIASMLLLATALVKAGFACANPSKRVALRILEANGCIEYWANRYQAGWSAVLTVVGTLIAALLAWRAVQAQIAKQNYSNAVTMLGLKRQQQRDVEHELLQIARALKTLRSLKAALRIHGRDKYGYLNAVRVMGRTGEFPFLKAGPSGHPMVTTIDEASVRAEGILRNVALHSDDVEVEGALREALGEILCFDDFLFSDLERKQALTVTLSDEVAEIEKIIAAGSHKLS